MLIIQISWIIFFAWLFSINIKGLFYIKSIDLLQFK